MGPGCSGGIEALPEGGGVESAKPKAQLELKRVRKVESNMKNFYEYIGGRRDLKKKKWTLCQMGQGTL